MVELYQSVYKKDDFKMEYDNFFVNHVPFPYFVLDNDLNIITKSSHAQRLFAKTSTFIELIDFQYHPETISFLQNQHDNEFIEVPMDGSDGNKRFHQIYKGFDNDLNLHVYCIPLKTELANLQEMINQVERKLFHFNQNLIEKKDYLEKTVEEMRGAAQTVDHQKNIEKLAAGIAHEIRNPLTTVKGFLQLLKPYLKELGKEQYAEVALEEINRANGIIFEFLNAAKPQTNIIQETSLNKLVQDIVTLYESEAILRNIQIVTSLSVQDITLHIAPNQLKQVLINLIKNAMEAIDMGISHERVIVVSTEITDEYAAIQIADSGCGMTNEVLKKLFIPFFSTKNDGTGIGLSVCKKIVEENGGKIQVKSEINKGTTFNLYFPNLTAAYPASNL